MQMIKRVVAASAVVGAFAAQSAFAALPTEVTAALDTAKTDGVTMGGIVLGVIIAIAAFKFLRRAM